MNLSDLEISKALALVIGRTVLKNKYCQDCWVWVGTKWRVFDYTDWQVAGPIAQYLYCFPRLRNGLWFISHKGIDYEAETPQKCIALAAIGILK